MALCLTPWQCYLFVFMDGKNLRIANTKDWTRVLIALYWPFFIIDSHAADILQIYSTNSSDRSFQVINNYYAQI